MRPWDVPLSRPLAPQPGAKKEQEVGPETKPTDLPAPSRPMTSLSVSRAPEITFVYSTEGSSQGLLRAQRGSCWDAACFSASTSHRGSLLFLGNSLDVELAGGGAAPQLPAHPEGHPSVGHFLPFRVQMLSNCHPHPPFPPPSDSKYPTCLPHRLEELQPP